MIDSHRNRGLLACALAGALTLAGCAPARPTVLTPSSASLLAEARAEGLDLQDPLAIDGEMASAIEKTAATLGTPEQRLRYLVRYLGDAGYVNFQYQEGRSLTAREAFGRAAEPWEVASVMVMLASDYTTYMTGEVVAVSSQHA